MKFKALLMPLLFLFSVNQSFADEKYICIEEKITGFVFDKNNKTWNPASSAGKNKFTITRSKNKNFAWKVNDFGSSLEFDMACRDDFNSNGSLHCAGMFTQLSMSKKH